MGRVSGSRSGTSAKIHQTRVRLTGGAPISQRGIPPSSVRASAHSCVRLRPWSLLLICCVFLVGCSGSELEPASDVAFAERDTRGVHELVEDVIAACMKQEGFDEYIRRPFIEPVNFVDVSLNVPNAETVGYGGVERGLRIGFAPASLGFPDPPQDSSASRSDYRAALYGSDLGQSDRDHDGSEHDHSHDEDHPDDHHHDGDVTYGGCIAEGAAFQSELQVDDDRLNEDTLMDVRNRLIATSEYEEYARRWRTCMAQTSTPIRADHPIGHTETTRSEYLERAMNRFGELTRLPDGAEVMDQLRNVGGAIDKHSSWLVEAASVDPTIAGLLAAERQLAVADAACRATAEHLVQPTYDNLYQELTGA